jgi:hypothetical protein
VIVVYGADHEDLKTDFLTELANSCRNMHFPYVAGGDFNILFIILDETNFHAWREL